MAAEQVIRVVAAVIHRGDRYLLCQRPFNKRHGGLWEFPGGKCLEGESDAQAIARELLEELGVPGRAAADRPLFEVRDPESPFLIAFIPASVEGDPVAREHIAIRWVDIEAMLGLPLAPSDRRFAESLR